MKKSLYIVLIMFCSLNLWGQTNRPVIWMHGLGSDSASWETTPNDFANNFRISSGVRGYSSHAGVATYANQVRSNNGTNTNNILIGHSMGGVVARDVLVKNPNFGGGLISIGSPLNGAYIANSKSMNRVLPKINKGVTALTAGPIASGLADLVLFFLGENLSAQDLVDNFLAGLEAQIGPATTTNGERDLMVQSDYMLSMRNATLNKPHLAIWGEELAPVSINYAATILNQQGIDNRTKAQMRDLRDDAQAVYNGMEIYYYSFGLVQGNAFYKASLWRDGKNYLKNDLENDWNYLIGSNRTDYYSQCWEEFQCNWDDYFNGGSMQRGTPDFTECPTVMVCSSQPVRINEPSDGFVDAFSQRGDLNLQKPTSVVRALGVNHNEEQTDEEVLDILDNAFDGQHGTFFRTPERN